MSNYTAKDLEALLARATVSPMINQIEINPANCDWELIRWCRGKNILVQAYSPLGRGQLLSSGVVLSIAQNSDATPAQVLIKWSLLNNFGTCICLLCSIQKVCIAKCSCRSRLQENLKSLEIELAESDVLTLSKGLECHYTTMLNITLSYAQVQK